MRARGNKVILEPVAPREASQEFRFVAQTYDNNSQGRILLVGPDVSPDLEIGQIVYFTIGREHLILDGKEVSVISDDDIVMVDGDEED